MSFLSKALFCVFSLVCSFQFLVAKEDHQLEFQTAAIEKALVLPQVGILKQKENGFVYLDVSNEFITEVVPLLNPLGIIYPRSTAPRSIGAHISVFHEKENVTPEELGKSFSFDLKDIRSFTVHTRDGLKNIWAISVDSSELEALREKYHCLPKLKGYDFHISLGKQMPKAPETWSETRSFSELNFSDEETLGLFQKGDFTIVENEKAIETAKKVNAVGQLTLKRNGYVYLDIDNCFVKEISPLLETQGIFNPLSTNERKVGAHISVFYEDEMIGKGIWNLKEAGQWFNFEVKQLRYVVKHTSKGEKRIWLLAVKAPALERLRTSYGLKPKLLGHDFHITLGHEYINVSDKLDEMEKEAA